MNFNKELFLVAFAASIESLCQSEAVTKREMRALSRSVLEATHETGDNAFMNRLLGVLTPVNRKVAVAFFTHFSGYSYDDKTEQFSKKSKKRYDSAFLAYVEFMADPNNNIWTWAERNIEVKQKEFSLDKLSKYMKNAIQAAHDANISQVDVLRAVMKGGIDFDTIVELMGEDISEDKKEGFMEHVASSLGFDSKVS